MNYVFLGRDSAFRAFMDRLTRFSPRRWTGTPLTVAEHVLGTKGIHSIERFCDVYRLNRSEFKQDNEHLLRVPYTEDELKFAARAGLVLTLSGPSVQQIFVSSPGPVSCVSIPGLVLGTRSELVPQSSFRCEWRLVLRTMSRQREDDVLKTQPKVMRRRMYIPPVELSLSTAFLDHRINRRLPPDVRLTATTVNDHAGNVVGRVMVGPASKGSTQALRVMVAQHHAEYPAMVAWTPHLMMRHL